MKVNGRLVEDRVIAAAVAVMHHGHFERWKITLTILETQVDGFRAMDREARIEWGYEHEAEIKRARTIAGRLIARELKAGNIEKRKQMYGHRWAWIGPKDPA